MDRGGNEYVVHRVYGYNVIESLLSSYDKIVYHEWIFVFVVNFCLRISVKCDLLSPTRSLLLYFTFVLWRWILVWKKPPKMFSSYVMKMNMWRYIEVFAYMIFIFKIIETGSSSYNTFYELVLILKTDEWPF